MTEKLIFNCTWGREEPERATLPFVAANIAATAGQEAIVLCTIEAVRLGCQERSSQAPEPSPLPDRAQHSPNARKFGTYDYSIRARKPRR